MPVLEREGNIAVCAQATIFNPFGSDKSSTWCLLKPMPEHSQDATDSIRCDSLLQRMFNRESFKLSELPSLIGQQCQPEQPHAFEYIVR